MRPTIMRRASSLVDLGARRYVLGEPITLGCPRCGGHVALSPAHTVGVGGNVRPAVRCPTATCGWSGSVQLAEYGEI